MEEERQLAPSTVPVLLALLVVLPVGAQPPYLPPPQYQPPSGPSPAELEQRRQLEMQLHMQQMETLTPPQPQLPLLPIPKLEPSQYGTAEAGAPPSGVVSIPAPYRSQTDRSVPGETVPTTGNGLWTKVGKEAAQHGVAAYLRHRRDANRSSTPRRAAKNVRSAARGSSLADDALHGSSGLVDDAARVARRAVGAGFLKKIGGGLIALVGGSLFLVRRRKR